MKYQLIILAAGKGKRMKQKELPKVLTPLKGKPVISYLLKELQKVPSIPKPIIVVGYKHALVEQTLGKSYTYALQRDQLGTAHAVMAAHDKITADNVLVLYGDVPFIRAQSLKRILDAHIQTGAALTMFTCHTPNFTGVYEPLNSYGRIIRDRYNNIVKITEYKDATDKERTLREVNPGIYVFNTAWLWQGIDQIGNKNAQKEYYLTDMVEVAINQGQTIHSLSISPEEIFGINTKDQLAQAGQLLDTKAVVVE